jgi:hypothetical protein
VIRRYPRMANATELNHRNERGRAAAVDTADTPNHPNHPVRSLDNRLSLVPRAQSHQPPLTRIVQLGLVIDQKKPGSTSNKSLELVAAPAVAPETIRSTIHPPILPRRTELSRSSIWDCSSTTISRNPPITPLQKFILPGNPFPKSSPSTGNDCIHQN